MRDLISNQRRRRLRVIKAVDEWSSKRAHDMASKLGINSSTKTVRNDIETLQRKLLIECRAKPSTSLRVDCPDAPSMNVLMDRPYLVIGSDSVCDLRLDHEEIKPRHYLLQWIDGHLFCCDISSRSSLVPSQESSLIGRWLDHEPVPIGPYRLSRCDEEVPVSPEFSPLDRSRRLATEYPLLALQFDGVEQTENVWPINRTLTLIGRGSQCKLCLKDEGIADVQAFLLRTSTGCWLMDLANQMTTGVNGKAIEIASLDIGDQLQIGTFRVEVVTLEIPSETIARPVPFPSILASKVPGNFIESKGKPAADRFHPAYNPLRRADDRSAKSDLKTMTELLVEQIPTTQEEYESRANRCQEPDTSRTLMESQSNIEMPVTSEIPEFVVPFIIEQQSQFVMLKQRLDTLKEIYNDAANRLISNRLRDSLENSVSETMQCLDLMKATLDDFIQKVEQKSE